MEAIGIVTSVLSLISSSTELLRAVQYLHFRMDNEHENYLRSLGKLEDVIDRIRTKLPKVNGIMPKDLGETIDLATKRAIEDVGSTRQLLGRVLHDTGTTSSRAATWGTRRPNYSSKTTSARSRELVQVSQETATFVGLLDTFEGADHYALDPPFYDFGNSSRPIFDDVEAIKPGGTSQVFRVGIHLSHIPDYGGESRKEVAFAVKKIYSESSQDYARERDAYRRMSLAQNPHPHIVPLFATYRMEGKYHFVFPSANCDLATYWRTQPRPSNDKRSLGWFGWQMRGLADAVSTIHGQKGQARDVQGVHGDIKPENILCFGSNDNDRWPGFALSDFGSSYFCTPEERDIPKGLKHTPAYRAPEIDTTNVGITQAYDIWSLGCVFAEAIAWFYDGKAGIAKLIDARLDEESNSSNRDAFFYVKYDFNKRGGLSAKLKPEIQRLIISLRRSSRSSLFMDDMLYIVLEGMLKVNMSERMSAREILDALTRMCIKLENDPAYSESRGNSDEEMVHHTQHASRRRLDNTVDANYYTNTTTQSLSDAQISLKPRFACPFHKAGILVSVHHRACEGPGWIDVNKVKEHLFRCHLPKKYRGKHICRRCDTSFETDELLLAHQHQETPCPKRKPEAIYGMLSREQAARLRSLKRKSSKESEEDRWFDIYRIAFPSFNRMLENVSPYHESNTTSLSTLNSTSSNGISQYKDYLRNRGAEEYAAKLAKMGISVTLEAAAKLLELQVKDLETFDETMREPVRAYGIPTDADHEKAGNSAPSDLSGSSDLFGPIQLLARYADDEEH
ncbi:CMGC protein kinase [Fusarium oxysporum f. sp. lycopersici 4287]|uniref:CMGC protein kinase n=2 Tax=Fusarium oxysporum TaxID=5507 RepID=A0A0J9VVG3_FUSO4|nr:CMGC protein kinase [Fusarium oxysporum f. sp. lycopersici 4287]EXK34722.1 CMGC protein kinase [Fusarium oxysporum f. sp. melonis 26406]KAJ9418145.1 CMGC protein kinase [Fusarium oxysporum]KNB14964.1 CMGC protein kinase [Fusarium oxysporum f. sp. lycopersici 4287]